MNSAVGSPINCGTFVGASAPSIAFDKSHIASRRFRLSATPISRVIVPLSTSNFTVQDRNVVRTIGNTTITDYEVDVEYAVPDFSIEVSISSLNSSVVLSPVGRIANGVAAGTATLKAEASSGEFAAKSVDVKITPGTSSDAVVSYVTGSAARSASEAVDNRIALKNSDAKPIYITQNHSSSSYVRNPNCWAADLDLTCISPWNSTGGGTRAGTLISPRHVLFCEHLDFHPAVNSTIRFVSLDNTVVNRTITALATHPDYSPYYPDITIGVLDSDVPNSISFAKILPSGWASYFPSIGVAATGATIPVLVLDQEEKALVSEWRTSGGMNIFAQPTDPQRLQFFESIITGDSGNPAFIVVNNQLVVINTLTYGGAGAGTFVSAHIGAINNMMTSLGGGYQLTEVDLSGFPSY